MISNGARESSGHQIPASTTNRISAELPLKQSTHAFRARQIKMIFIAALNPRRPAGAAAATLSAGSLLISSTQTQLIYQKGFQRSKNPMSEKERIQIYQRVGTNKLKEWADDTNINFMDELAEDSDLSDAFRSFLRQRSGDISADAWELLRQGAVAESAGKPTQDIRNQVKQKFNGGCVRIHESHLKVEDFDSESMGCLFETVTKNLKTSFPEQPSIAEFRPEISKYVEENKPKSESLRKRFTRSCSLF